MSTALLDLREFNLAFADGTPTGSLSDDSPRLIGEISLARTVILATPIYRATLTGVLKNAIDLLPVEALRRKPVGVVAMGATLHHYLGAESHLRDIMAWFGAIVLPASVYLSAADFADGVVARARAADLDALIDTAQEFAERLEFLPDRLSPLYESNS